MPHEISQTERENYAEKGLLEAGWGGGFGEMMKSIQRYKPLVVK